MSGASKSTISIAQSLLTCTFPDYGLTLVADDGLHTTLKAKYPHHAEEIEKLGFGTYDVSNDKKYV